MKDSAKPARQEMFIAAMLQSRTIKEAAEKCGIPQRSAYKLAKVPEVAAAIENAKKASLECAYEALKGALTMAVDTLKAVAEDTSVQPSTRAYAAQMLLQNALPYARTVDIEKKIRDLEAMQIEAVETYVRPVPVIPVSTVSEE